MNDRIQNELSSLVERAVRPVRASWLCKRRMRQELLAHVIDAFEEELAAGVDEQTAVQQTQKRFGNVEELSEELQHAAPLVERLVFNYLIPKEILMWRWLRSHRWLLIGLFAMLFGTTVILPALAKHYHKGMPFSSVMGELMMGVVIALVGLSLIGVDFLLTRSRV